MESMNAKRREEDKKDKGHQKRKRDMKKKKRGINIRMKWRTWK